MANQVVTLKRWNGGSWDELYPTIPTTALTGTILDAQIAGMAATKLTGTIDKARLPSIAITETIVTTVFSTYISGSYSDTTGNMEGDILVCTTDKTTYIHDGGTAGDATDWTLLETPTDVVTSVAGQAGVVTTPELRTAIGTDNATVAALVPSVGIAGQFLKHDNTWGTPSYIANTFRGIDDTPVNGQTAESISSNWAFDHNAGTGLLKHVPSGGNSGEFLKHDGTWGVPATADDEYIQYVTTLPGSPDTGDMVFHYEA